PNDDIRNQGIRIMKNKANWDSFVLTGCNADPRNRDGVWKVGSTSSQFRIQKQEDEAYDYKGIIIGFDCTALKFNNQLVSPLSTPPIEYAIQQSIAYGIGTPSNIPLNAFMYNTKQPTTPVVWLNPIAIDCYIDPVGHININSICKYYLPDDFCVQVCDSYAVYNQSA
ncbi:MAG: hypothetical protein EZS28_046919, partial [Streblomastix strix]